MQEVFRQVGRIVDQSIKQVCSGNHPICSILDNRNESLAVFDDKFLNVSKGCAEWQGFDLVVIYSLTGRLLRL